MVETLGARFHAAIIAAGYHFCGTLLLILVSATIVFCVWYPFPYRELAGGTDLFVTLVLVDIICGPLLTLVLFNPLKSRRELTLDISVIVFVQMAALVYGIISVAQARPVYLVFEVDRFKVVSIADVQMDSLRPELGGLQLLPWMGPKVIGVRDPRNPEEKFASLEMSLRGIEPSSRPDWWQTYELSKPQVQMRAQSIERLRRKKPEAHLQINEAIADSGKLEAELGWLPLTSFKSTGWVAFIDLKTAEVLAFAPVDGF